VARATAAVPESAATTPRPGSGPRPRRGERGEEQRCERELDPTQRVGDRRLDMRAGGWLESNASMSDQGWIGKSVR
jgi:hypothetical protein